MDAAEEVAEFDETAAVARFDPHSYRPTAAISGGPSRQVASNDRTRIQFLHGQMSISAYAQSARRACLPRRQPSAQKRYRGELDYTCASAGRARRLHEIKR